MIWKEFVTSYLLVVWLQLMDYFQDGLRLGSTKKIFQNMGTHLYFWGQTIGTLLSSAEKQFDLQLGRTLFSEFSNVLIQSSPNESFGLYRATPNQAYPISYCLVILGLTLSVVKKSWNYHLQILQNRGVALWNLLGRYLPN